MYASSSRRAALLLGCLLLTTVRSGSARAEPAATAPAAALGIGDKAPPPSIDDWIHPGSLQEATPLAAYEPGTIYVIVFWATWCEHSREAIPLLSSLQQRHGRDVVIIAVGVDSPDFIRGFLADSDPDVRHLAAQMGACCVVADPDGSMHENYMDAIQETGVPTAFVVGRQGLVEWIGHPLAIEEPLDRIVEGSWERQAFARRWSRLQAARQVVHRAAGLIAADQAAAAATEIDRFTADHASDALALNEVAWMLVEHSDYAPVPAPVLAAAERAAARGVAIEPDNGNTLDTLAHIQALLGEVDRAIATQRRAVEHGGDDAARFEAYLRRLESQQR